MECFSYIIGYTENPGNGFDNFKHLESKIYGAHDLDSVIDYTEHLDHALNAFRHLDEKNYRATTSTSSSATPGPRIK